jgi:hypothetical protein
VILPLRGGSQDPHAPGDLHGTGNPSATSTAKTGISIENLPAKSAVSTSVDANDAGEHLPLVYVLICQKAAWGNTTPIYVVN